MIAEMNIPNDKVTVIPNGVDLGLFRIMEKKKVRARLGIPDGKPVFVTVCSLDKVKGINFLIDALKIMRDRTTIQPLLYVIGDGPLKKSLFSQAKSLGIAETVFFLGEEPYEHIPFWMNATDVFCLPSLREGYPNSVIEALACGVPVVASDVGGIPEIINERNGRIAKASDPISLCDQLLFCLKASWNRVSIRGSVENYTWQDCAEKYISCYTSTIERKGQL